MKRSPRLVACAALVAVVALGACGGDDDDDAADTTTAASAATTETDGSTATTPDGGSASDDPQDYIDALAANTGLADDGVSECLAGAVVDTIGMDRIEESGLSPQEFAESDGQLGDEPALSADQKDELQDALGECEGVAEAFLQTGTFSDDVGECVAEVVDDAVAAEILAVQLTQGELSDDAQAASDAADECLAADTATSGPLTSDPTTTTTG